MTRLVERPAGLLLDLDGTLVLSEEVHRLTWRHFFDVWGADVDEHQYEQSFKGRRATDVLSAVPGPWTGRDLAALSAEMMAHAHTLSSEVEPVAGRVAKVHPHALAIADEAGTGVLVHLGIDTVRLKGEGFALLVADGDELPLGAPVITFDPTAVRAAGYSAVCPVVILGSPKDSTQPAVDVGSTVAPGVELFSWSPAS